MPSVPSCAVLPREHASENRHDGADAEHRPTRDGPAPVPVALRAEDPAAEDHQQGGEQRDHHEEGRGDADGEDRSEPGGRVEVGDDEAQHPDHDGRGAGEDCGRGPVEGERHRLVPVLVTAQLLAVAGDQEQCVVGAGADHQDAQDRLALPVDGEVGVLRQEVDDAGGDEVRDDRADDGEQPEHRAAVGHQQDQHHDQEGREDQVGVDALEGLGGVGGLAAEAREVDGHTVDLRDVAGLVGGVRNRVPALVTEVPDEIEVADLAVVGEELLGQLHLLRHVGREDVGAAVVVLVGDAVDLLGDLGRLGVHRGEVVVGEAAVAVVDDERRDLVGVDGPGELVEDLGRLRGAGEPGRRLVVLDVGQLGVERHHEAGEQDHCQGHEPLGDGAGEFSGDLTVHGQNSSSEDRHRHQVLSLLRPREPQGFIGVGRKTLITPTRHRTAPSCDTSAGTGRRRRTTRTGQPVRRPTP